MHPAALLDAGQDMRYAMLLCLMIPALAHALGTLFYSPAERRLQGRAVEVYRLEGIVKRSAGRSVAWINGRAVFDNDPDFPALGIYSDHILLNGVIIRPGESKEVPKGEPESRNRP